MLNNKTILITGGTGSFGNTFLNHLLNLETKEIRIFSRDEKKQDDMRKKYNDKRIKFYIGDVRDYSSILNSARGANYIFHAAALKQVPSCEFFPMEAVKTNVLGTENVLEAGINCGVDRIVCLSTDKAVYPINAMGISKALMEKIIISKSRIQTKTIICITRYGNVMASRGSVIPLFVDQIMTKAPITITDLNMTRFMMSLDEALNLVLYAFNHGKSGDIFVQKSPAATIDTLTKALCDLLLIPDYPVITIGTRHGEKLYEVLLSREEKIASKDLGIYYQVSPDSRDLNYEKYIESGQKEISEMTEYTSHNTMRLNIEDTKKLLIKLPLISNLLLKNKLNA
jgi:UDP-glucose 4-epimerase